MLPPGVGVAVGPGVGTIVGVGDGTAVGVAVGIGVGVGAAVAVGAGVGTAVAVGIGVGGTAVGVGVTDTVVGTGVGVPACNNDGANGPVARANAATGMSKLTRKRQARIGKKKRKKRLRKLAITKKLLRTASLLLRRYKIQTRHTFVRCRNDSYNAILPATAAFNELI